MHSTHRALLGLTSPPAKANFRPHTLSHSLENVAAQFSPDVGPLQLSLHPRSLTSISSMSSADLDTLWLPLTLSLERLCLFLNAVQQQHTASQHCPCPLCLLRAQPCVLVFTTVLAELFSPVWLALPQASAWLSSSLLDWTVEATVFPSTSVTP